MVVLVLVLVGSVPIMVKVRLMCVRSVKLPFHCVIVAAGLRALTILSVAACHGAFAGMTPNMGRAGCASLADAEKAHSAATEVASKASDAKRDFILNSLIFLGWSA